jgi:DNA-binding CsgD family transcriptional regulator
MAFRSLVLAHRGDVDAARESIATTLNLIEETAFRIGELWAVWAQAIIASGLGDPSSVDRALAGPTSFVESYGLDDPIRAPFLGDEIEALIGLGQRDRAAQLIQLMERGSRGRLWVRLVVARCTALLKASQNQLDDARAALDEVLADPTTEELPIELGRTLLVLAQVERRAKKRASARNALVRAGTLFSNAGAGLWLRRSTSEVRLLGLDADRPPGLTPSEERIARLVASGLTSRDVATRLLISPKTVEATLTRVYSKLAIHSRAELGSLLGRVASDAGRTRTR